MMPPSGTGNLTDLRQPEVGCGAAILNDAGELLLIQRLRKPETGAWGLPGGKIDFGERAEVAVVREIEEELGIEIALSGLACFSEIIDGGDGRHWVSPIFAARVVSGEPKLMEPEKHGGWGWFALDDLPDKITTPTKSFIASLASPRPDASHRLKL